MGKTETTTVVPAKPRGRSMGDSSGETPTRRPPQPGTGILTQYKPEQGKATRTGTFVGAGLLVTWGAYFLYDHLRIYEGDELWRLLVTLGIPILFVVIF